MGMLSPEEYLAEDAQLAAELRAWDALSDEALPATEQEAE